MAIHLRELTIRFGTARASDGERVRLPVGDVDAAPREVASLLDPLLAHEPVEVFSVLCLSVKRLVVGYSPISRGTLDGTIVHPREVFRTAIPANAGSVVLLHSHPSGDPSPSPDDDRPTVRLVACGELMGVGVAARGPLAHQITDRIICRSRDADDRSSAITESIGVLNQCVH